MQICTTCFYLVVLRKWKMFFFICWRRKKVSHWNNTKEQEQQKRRDKICSKCGSQGDCCLWKVLLMLVGLIIYKVWWKEKRRYTSHLDICGLNYKKKKKQQLKKDKANNNDFVYCLATLFYWVKGCREFAFCFFSFLLSLFI